MYSNPTNSIRNSMNDSDWKSSSVSIRYMSDNRHNNNSARNTTNIEYHNSNNKNSIFDKQVHISKVSN